MGSGASHDHSSGSPKGVAALVPSFYSNFGAKAKQIFSIAGRQGRRPVQLVISQTSAVAMVAMATKKTISSVCRSVAFLSLAAFMKPQRGQ